MDAAAASGVDAGPDVLAAAVALRWSRPDLTRLLAEHLAEGAEATGDRAGWLAAAGWSVHAAHAVGDGRETASAVLDQLTAWGDDVLADPAADRLRVELAVVAHDAGDTPTASALLARPAAPDDVELAADRAVALARCAAVDGSVDVVTAAEAAWDRVPGPRGRIGLASARLVAAAAERRRGRATEAVVRAVSGLTGLDRARGSGGGPTPSGYLAAALAAEWITALADGGRMAQARDVLGPLQARLEERTRPTRQLAHLRLTIARVLATGPGEAAVEELQRAVRDAAAADVPDLEHLCRTALGELHESRGRAEAATESVRLAVLADHRHRARAERLHRALTAVGPLLGAARDHEPAPDDDEIATTVVLRAVRPRPDPGPGADPWSTGSWGAGPATRPNGSARGPGAAGSPSVRDPRDGRGGGPSSDAASLGAGAAGSGRRRRPDRPDDRARPSGPRADQRAGSPAEGGPGGRPDGGALHERAGHRGVSGAEPDGGASDDSAGRPVEDGLGGRSDGRAPHEYAGHRAVPGAEPDSGAPHDGAGRLTVPAGDPASATDEDRTPPRAEPGSPGGAANGGTRGARSPGAPAAGPAQQVRYTDRPGDRNAQPRAVEGGQRPGGRSGRPVDDPGAAPRTHDGDRGSSARRLVSDADHGVDTRRGVGPSGSAEPGPPAPGAQPWSAATVWGAAAGAGNASESPSEAADARPDRADARPDSAAEEVLLPGGVDPEAWLTAALAELDRIWNDPAEADDPARGCVVVLDLAHSGDAVDGPEAVDTMREVAARLADRLPAGSRLREDAPGALSVVMPGSDCATASEWMRTVVPAVADGLAVTGPSADALLRASVHGTDGVVGAQVLQRLDRSPDSSAGSWPRQPGAAWRGRYVLATRDDGADALFGPRPEGAHGDVERAAAHRVSSDPGRRTAPGSAGPRSAGSGVAEPAASGGSSTSSGGRVVTGSGAGGRSSTGPDTARSAAVEPAAARPAAASPTPSEPAAASPTASEPSTTAPPADRPAAEARASRPADVGSSSARWTAAEAAAARALGLDPSADRAAVVGTAAVDPAAADLGRPSHRSGGEPDGGSTRERRRVPDAEDIGGTGTDQVEGPASDAPRAAAAGDGVDRDLGAVTRSRGVEADPARPGADAPGDDDPAPGSVAGASGDAVSGSVPARDGGAGTVRPATPPPPFAVWRTGPVVRRPYLPDGVVVRPGSGGRRHRPVAAPDAEDRDADRAADRVADQSDDRADDRADDCDDARAGDLREGAYDGGSAGGSSRRGGDDRVVERSSRPAGRGDEQGGAERGVRSAGRGASGTGASAVDASDDETESLRPHGGRPAAADGGERAGDRAVTPSRSDAVAGEAGGGGASGPASGLEGPADAAGATDRAGHARSVPASNRSDAASDVTERAATERAATDRAATDRARAAWPYDAVGASNRFGGPGAARWPHGVGGASDATGSPGPAVAPGRFHDPAGAGPPADGPGAAPGRSEEQSGAAGPAAGGGPAAAPRTGEDAAAEADRADGGEPADGHGCDAGGTAEEPPDGLGLADLLAGALAAYRRI